MQQPKSSKIWAFLIGMFWVSFVTYYVLWKSYQRVVYMRDRAQASAHARPQQYTVLVRDMPKPVGKESRNQQVDSFFARVHPGSYNREIPVYNIKRVSKLQSNRLDFDIYSAERTCLQSLLLCTLLQTLI